MIWKYWRCCVWSFLFFFALLNWNMFVFLLKISFALLSSAAAAPLKLVVLRYDGVDMLFYTFYSIFVYFFFIFNIVKLFGFRACNEKFIANCKIIKYFFHDFCSLSRLHIYHMLVCDADLLRSLFNSFLASQYALFCV